MSGKFIKVLLAGIFILAAIGIGVLIVFPASGQPRNQSELSQGRVIIPQTLSGYFAEENPAEQIARLELMTLKTPLEDGEILTALLTEDIDGDLHDEQIVAFRNLLDIESRIFLTCIDYDESSQTFTRAWTAPTSATRPGTLALYTQDLIGDRGTCVLISGMNGQGEHTLTVFRNIPAAVSPAASFKKIAEIRIDGSIIIRETERPQAYQLGMARGESYSLSAFGRDHESSNLLDQIEISFTFNDETGVYEESTVTRIPGTQVEQRRVRELLGNVKAFEDFISGLWYYVSPQGTLDNQQYIYFDPQSREIIFYGDETQQVFTWQNSNASRYGLYVASQNISVSTLRRSIDIELESLDSIKVKVFEDVRLKIGVNAPWDGSYRKASSPENQFTPPAAQPPYINAVYDSPLGKIHFYPDGNFSINSGNTARQGKYAFFTLDNDVLLELRDMENRSAGIRVNTGSRETYLVKSDAAGDSSGEEGLPKKILSLSRVRLGARGIQPLHENPVILSLSGDTGSGS